MNSIARTITRTILNGDLPSIQKYFQELTEEKNYSITVNDYISFVVRSAEIGELDIVQYLISNFHMLKIFFLPGFLESKALIFACSGGQIDIVRVMIQQGADPSENGYHSYVCACEEMHHHIIEYLLSLDGQQTVYPEQTSYNIEWAMDKKHLSLVFVMMKQLKKRDIFQYLEYWPEVMSFYKKHNGSMFILELEQYDIPEEHAEISITL